MAAAITEFDLIARIRTRAIRREDVLLGIGDDAAILRVPPGHDLVVSTDTLNIGVHFPSQTAPFDIGWKSLAVNLSDLAAMGAEPAWCTLNLTLPQADGAWLDGFLDGFLELAARHRVALVGGDTTRGPLSVTATMHGFVPHDAALLRTRAQAGDEVWVSGTLGDAAAGLALLSPSPPGGGFGERVRDIRVALLMPNPFPEGEGARARSALIASLDRPMPRVALGIALRGIANACIDVSDGLLADLGHVLDESGVGAEIDSSALPTSPELAQAFDLPTRTAFQLSGGDDYELCFTATPARARDVEAAADRSGVSVTRIGRIEARHGLRLRDAAGIVVDAPATGYRHFDTTHEEAGSA